MIADATGLTSVHVNRILRTFREDGLVDVSRREVVVKDWDELVAAGNFDLGYLQNDINPEERLRIVKLL